MVLPIISNILLTKFIAAIWEHCNNKGNKAEPSDDKDQLM